MNTTINVADTQQTASEMIARWEAMKSTRLNWMTMWDDIARYIIPRKGNILTKYSPGQRQTINLYDSTAETALGVAAAGMLTHIMPAGEKWFQLSPKGKQPSQAFRDWLDQLTDVCTDLIYSSNFYLSAHEDLLDALGFGTSCMLLEEGKRRALNFINVPVGTFAIDEDAEGMVDTVGREWKWTARQAMQKWGREKLGPLVLKALESKTPSDWNRQFTFIHFVEPRTSVDYKGGMVAGIKRPIRSVFLCVEDSNIIDEDGYYEMPVLCSRLERSNNELYGRGPGEKALTEIKLVNAMERDILTWTERMGAPPWLSPDDANASFDFRPDGVTYYDSTVAGAKPEQVELHNRVDLAEQKTEQKRNAIREKFFNNLFQLLTNADQMKRDKTAYEVQQMVAEKLILFSPIFARYVQEKTNPMLERVVGIAIRNGLIDPPPPDVARGAEYEIVYTSKIALAIKAAENQSFATMMQLVEQMMQLDPSTKYLVKWRDGGRRVMRNIGLPASLQRTDSDIDKMLAADMKAAQAQQAAQTMELATRSAKNLGPEGQKQAVEKLPQAAAAMQ